MGMETGPSLCLFVSNSPVYTWTLYFWGTGEVCHEPPASVGGHNSNWGSTSLTKFSQVIIKPASLTCKV